MTRAMIFAALVLVSCAAPAKAPQIHTPCFVYAQRLPGVVYPLGSSLHCDPTIPMRMTTSLVTR